MGVHGQGKVEADEVRVQDASVKLKIKGAAVEVAVVTDVEIAAGAVGVIARHRDWVCERQRVGRDDAESGWETLALGQGVVADGSVNVDRVASYGKSCFSKTI